MGTTASVGRSVVSCVWRWPISKNCISLFNHRDAINGTGISRTRRGVLQSRGTHCTRYLDISSKLASGVIISIRRLRSVRFAKMNSAAAMPRPPNCVFFCHTHRNLIRELIRELIEDYLSPAKISPMRRHAKSVQIVLSSKRVQVNCENTISIKFSPGI